MRKITAILCLSLILSAITHVCYGHERAKETKTEFSISSYDDTCNFNVVGSSTNFVVAFVASKNSTMEYAYNGLNLFCSEKVLMSLPYDHGLIIRKGNILLTSKLTNLNTSNTFATIKDLSFTAYDPGIYLQSIKSTYNTPFVDKTYIWKYSIRFNC